MIFSAPPLWHTSLAVTGQNPARALSLIRFLGPALGTKLDLYRGRGPLFFGLHRPRQVQDNTGQWHWGIDLRLTGWDQAC